LGRGGGVGGGGGGGLRHPCTQIVVGDQNGGVSILRLEGVRVGGQVQDTYREPEAGTRVVPVSVTVARAGGGGSSSSGGGGDDEGKGAATDAMAHWTSVPIVTMTRLYLNDKYVVGCGAGCCLVCPKGAEGNANDIRSVSVEDTCCEYVRCALTHRLCCPAVHNTTTGTFGTPSLQSHALTVTPVSMCSSKW